MSNKSKFPRKFSEFLELGLSNVKMCHLDPNYRLDQHEWHNPDSRGVCHVCLAGAVMAKTFKVDRKLEMKPTDLQTVGEKDRARLFAYDLVIRGRYTLAMKTFLKGILGTKIIIRDTVLEAAIGVQNFVIFNEYMIDIWIKYMEHVIEVVKNYEEEYAIYNF